MEILDWDDKECCKANFAFWKQVHAGYCDDPRATDNAWVESCFLHLHVSETLLQQLEAKGASDVAIQAMRNVLQAGMTGTQKVGSQEYKWLSVDDPDQFNSFFGSQGYIALKARQSVYQPLQVEQIEETACVALTADPKRMRRLMKTINNITGLLDTRDAPQLLESLWLHAGCPNATFRPFPKPPWLGHASATDSTTLDDTAISASIEDILRYMKDRKNWTRWNLQLLYNCHGVGRWKHGIQCLVELEEYTTRQYTSCLSMPTNLVSLSQCNNIEPFDEFIVAADKLECISSSAFCTEFRLDARAFNSGSMLTTREHMQQLKLALVHLHRCFSGEVNAEEPINCSKLEDATKRKRHFPIRASPVASLKWSAEMQALAGIPSQAELFCFSCPVHNLAVDDVRDCLRNISKAFNQPDPDNHGIGENSWPDDARIFLDPFFLFLTTGGFMFFDNNYQIVAIQALSFVEQKMTKLAAHTTKLFFGHPDPRKPHNLPHTAVRPLVDCDRWEFVTVPTMKSFGFTHFAWIKPFEFIGDHVFPEYGGFAYLNKHDWRISQFFPIVDPYDDRGAINMGPKEYDAPLHIPELDSIGHDEDLEYEAALDILDLSPAALPTMDQAKDAMSKLVRKYGDDSERAREVKDAFAVVKKWIETRATEHSSKFIVDFENDNFTASSELVLASGNQSAKGLEVQLGFPHVSDLIAHEQHLRSVDLVDEVRKLHESYDGQDGDWAELHPLIDKAMAIINERQRAFEEQTQLAQVSTPTSLMRETSELKDDKEKSQLHNCRTLFLEVLRYVCKKRLSHAEKKKHLQNICHVLFEDRRDENAPLDPSNDGHSMLQKDGTRTDISLRHFASQPESTGCGLILIEVAALRFYTTSSYTLVNDPLRQTGSMTTEQLEKDHNRHPLAVTTYYVTSALKKLRANNFRTADSQSDKGKPIGETPTPAAAVEGTASSSDMTAHKRTDTSRHVGSRSYLWRGMKDRTMSDQFLMKGGAELACMSTSQNIEVVARYARSNNPLLMRIKIESPMDRGADLKWLSVYPSEDEVLYPPLTYLKPLFKQKILGMEEGHVVTLKAVFPS